MSSPVHSHYVSYMVVQFFQRQRVSFSRAHVVSFFSKMPVNNCFTILYGSQTGQAKAIAEEIHERAEEQGFRSKLFCLSLTDKKFTIDKEKLVVFVASTTGEGDPPDTMSKFMRRLKKKTLPSDHLQDSHFAVLALGDSNYTNFCNCGKSLDKRMLALGAQHFYDTGYADDAVGLELVVEPWIEGLWRALRMHFEISEGSGTCDQNEQNPDQQHGSEDNHILGDNKVGSPSSPTIMNLPTTKPLAEKVMQDTPQFTDANKAFESQDVAGSDLNAAVNKNSASVTNGKLRRNDDTEPGLMQKSNKVEAPSLLKSEAPLSASALSVPQLPAAYLEVDFHPDEQTLNNASFPPQECQSFPGATTGVSMATIVSARRLTGDDAVKTALDVELDITGCGITYVPGDSFGIVCPNDAEEVNALIERLSLNAKADMPFTVKILETTTKKTARLPEHIPPTCTVRHALTACLEIRTVPKKALLRVLVEHTTGSSEKRRLQELCSKQGAADYTEFIRNPSVSFVGILQGFQSCHPPLERLLEHLPRLMPRLYSVASSPLQKENHLHFVFNIVKFPAIPQARQERLGVCTGWLHTLTAAQQDSQEKNKGELQDKLCEELSRLKLSGCPKVPVFGRKNLHFKLPENPSIPVLMIGPGTGIAPFMGFLQHRQVQMRTSDSTPYGPMWLFFGCRHKDRDNLYENELEEYQSTGVLSKLFVSFSRDPQDDEGNPLPRYVQHNLQLHAAEVADLIFNQGAVIYICGDAKNMARNVLETFLEIFQQYKGISLEEGRKELMQLRADERYHEDIWT